jgi:NAD(P)-dependent dehydrogenase (short-subunit alcohol dehydrogenase family)
MSTGDQKRLVRALVTGAAGGLGGAVVERLARDGCPVMLVDRSAAVDAAAERLKGLSTSAVVSCQGDVADEAFAERAVGTAVHDLGGLDLLVNAAGIGGEGGSVLETSAENFRRVLDVNVVGSFLLARASARAMIDQGGGGCIVNFGSLFGQRAVPGSSPYCTSKGAITLLTQALALELAEHSIRVNTVSPGYMATEMHWDFLRGVARDTGTTFEEEVARVRATIPIGRHGTGEDVAGAVMWLASQDASYVTGQTLALNGGAALT